VDILVYTKILSARRHFVDDFLLVKLQNTKEGQAFRHDIIIKTKNDVWYRNATFKTTLGVEGEAPSRLKSLFIKIRSHRRKFSNSDSV
jgi:hypothetical protein